MESALTNAEKAKFCRFCIYFDLDKCILNAFLIKKFNNTWLALSLGQLLADEADVINYALKLRVFSLWRIELPVVLAWTVRSDGIFMAFKWIPWPDIWHFLLSFPGFCFNLLSMRVCVLKRPRINISVELSENKIFFILQYFDIFWHSSLIIPFSPKGLMTRKT